MKEENEGYYKLVMKIFGCKKEDILSLREEDVDVIDAMVNGLKPKWAKALRMRFALKEGFHTLKEASVKMGVTSSMVRVYEVSALRDLKHPSKIRWFKNFLRSRMEELDEEIRQKDETIASLRAELIKKESILEGIKKTMIAGEHASELIPIQSALVLTHDVGELEVSVRAYNGIKNSNIKTIGELIQKTERELLITKNFGRKALDSIIEGLAKFGLRLGMKLS